MAEKKYWKGLDEFNQTDEFIQLAQQEFPEDSAVDITDEADSQLKTGRRDFLKMMGFSLTAATVAAGCEIPVRKVAPYIFKPEDILPGIATWYASSMIQGGNYCSILVKTREGRPIKIEGNKDSKITMGAAGARAQAYVLSLYDTARFRNPLNKKSDGSYEDTDWESIDKAITGKLLANPSSNIRILTSTVLSPSTKNLFTKFQAKYPNTKVYSYDAISYSGMLMANEASHKIKAIPHYDFAKAKVIVSLDADFLGSWISELEYTKGYSTLRKVSKENAEMSRHYQIESRLSITGSNADYRIAVLPSEISLATLNLYDAVTGGSLSAGQRAGDEAKQSKIREAAEWLKKHEGECLVVSGSNNVNEQLVVNAINEALGNYGNTISFENPSMLRQGLDSDLQNFVADLKAKQCDIAMIYDCNPVYDTPYGSDIAAALATIPVTISFAGSMDETAQVCTFICPDHHGLESWNDAEPRKGYYSLSQPTIHNLFSTRQMQDSLLVWAELGMTYSDFMMQTWSETILANELNKSHAFNKALQIGLHQPGTIAEQVVMAMVSDTTAQKPINPEVNETPALISTVVSTNVAEAAARILTKATKAEGVQVSFYENILGDGRYANNPWLQELPDPVSKITWDNYLNVSPLWAEENNLTHGDIVSLIANGYTVDLPIAIQPGQAYGSTSVALGYGRTVVGKVGEGIGANVFPMLDTSGDTVNNYISNVEINKTGKNISFSQTQTHFSLNDGFGKRTIVKETTLSEYQKNSKAGNTDRAKILEELDTFYPDFFAEKNGFNWGMSVDLNSCTGCGACVVACNAENNIPVVGKHEVLRSHEMHWMRIDRYYAGDDPENPEVVFQPMLCQHCENAPCENVCPVGATNHSHEGFNQMAYNRCIGTRYCANNCPYKVRRFNWFDYGGSDTFGKMNDPHGTTDLGMLEDLTRMVLNPDVTVRSRGVIEKCSFCVQRIQDAKLTAKKENRQLKDGEIRTACQSTCPADAIVFGNMYDSKTAVYKANTDDRAYGIIEEMHWLPSVLYLTKVRNKEAADHVHEQALDIMNLYNYH